VLPTAAYAGAADTSIKSATPTKNLGTADPLEVSGNAASYVLLKWDLTPGVIPAGSRVLAAEIAVNVTDATANAFAIYELRRDWVERQATWRLAQIGTNWQVAGAQGANDRGPTVLGTATGAVGARTWALNAAGVALVQNWVSAPASNNGVTIQGPATMQNLLRFNADDAKAAASRPKLTLCYLAP
jgi:hypothetical protein